MNGAAPPHTRGWTWISTWFLPGLRAPPHTRGWTPPRTRLHRRRPGSPAHAGMDPGRTPGTPGRRRLPRTRGDGPVDVDVVRRPRKAPRTRGDGPKGGTGATDASGLPRTRGDGPDAPEFGAFCNRAPPHTRGWTPMHSCARSGTRGSPAHAGMDPTPSSARPRRCRLPRTRGDGPGSEPLRYRWKVAPPHTRGWTPAAGAPPILRRGSPAHAGMDRRQRARDAGFQRLPRTRGDGPIAGFPGGLTSRAPPHTRGWTRAALGAGARQDGSPAHAGMDPLYVVDNRSPFGLPRTRGDGPLAAAQENQLFELPRTRGDGPRPNVARLIA